MKNNSLINTISPKQQYAVRRWFIISMLLLSASIIIIILLEIPQLYALRSIKKDNEMLVVQTEEFDRVMARQHKLQQEEQQFKKRQETVNQYREQLDRLIDNFSHIMYACASDSTIESLQIKNNHLELTARCTQAHHATDFIERLSQSKQFSNLTLTSLQQTEQKSKLLFTVQGEQTVDAKKFK